MSDFDAVPHSVTSRAASEEPEDISICTTFSSPAANVFLHTSDGTIFQTEELYLRASSVVFKDLPSPETSSLEKPICVDEKAEDFLIVMYIINGRPQEAIHLPTSYEQAKRLYKIMDKYLLDIHQPWFSDMCGDRASENPLDALFLACNRPVIDTTLARFAISSGFAKAKASKIYDPTLFAKEVKESTDSYQQTVTSPLLELLTATNATIGFGLAIGFKGLMSYHKTFTNLQEYILNPTGVSTYDIRIQRHVPAVAKVDWHALAEAFVSNAREVETQMRSTE